MNSFNHAPYRLTRQVVVAIGILGVCLSPNSSHAQDVTGKLASVQNDVQTRRSDADVWQASVLNQPQ